MRDPAQPLLTLYDGDARVELSGTTTANWVAKSANLLVDGLGDPERVGILLPLHWQAVVLLLAATTTGAEVILARDAAQLAECDAAFVLAGDASAALDAGADEVLALSGSPLGAPCGPLPSLVLDYAREVPSYGDHYGGARPRAAQIVLDDAAVEPLEGVVSSDRVLTSLPFADPTGAAVLISALRAGAGLILLAAGDAGAIAAAEHATMTAGTTVEGLTRWA